MTSGAEAPRDCEVLVVGSGAGGALTAALLSEAGRDVTLLEEGPWMDPDSVEPFSIEEMTTKYRSGGAGVALGRPPIAYVEGRCVGGSTEINSGLYHRPPAELVEAWRTRYHILDLTPSVLDRYSTEIERSLSVSRLPGPPPTASAVLERGATKMGWRATEVPRVFRYDAVLSPGVKQTMSRTYIPRAVAAGARVVPACRVERLVIRDGRAIGARVRIGHEDGRVERSLLRAGHVFVCAGAIGTASLLQRSGIRRNVGTGLKVHPTVKLAARFPFPIEDRADVPMHQVLHFAPDLTLGGSISRREYIALALADSWDENAADMEKWESIGVYYAAIRSDGWGRVLSVPGFTAPIVTYRLADSDLSRLARGLTHLAELLFAAGAVELYPSISDAPSLRSVRDIGNLWGLVGRANLNLMTIHLFSTIGMGEDDSETGADSHGRVWGVENLRVNDTSLLPDAPGVNPQGVVMAFAARNCDHFLGTLPPS